MKNIVCFRKRATIHHATDMSKSGSRGRWPAAVRGTVPLIAMLLVGLTLMDPNAAVAGSWRVNSPDDTDDVRPGDETCLDSKGNCTLRAAIQESNKKGQGHKIYLLAGNYHIKSALPPITSSLFIQGKGDGPEGTVIW
jgi:CSLREA domain-containing protein